MTVEEIKAKVLCTKSHEYLLEEGNTYAVGITDHAVEQLGDIVFVELPEPGATFSKGEVFGTIESVKAASELYMPAGGKVVAVNELLISEPELINSDCFGQGWLIKITDVNQSELDDTMHYEDYCAYLEEEEE